MLDILDLTHDGDGVIAGYFTSLDVLLHAINSYDRNNGFDTYD